jgi:hypothetical protein
MDHGGCQKNMSNILNSLGVDGEDLDWWHLSVCRGMDTNLFYEKYEVDDKIAKNIDEACLACPVIKMCYKNGVENNEHGVWGGVYLNSGAIDKPRNIHKSPEIWKRLRAKNVH